ncbi:hypothetical protein O181_014142 [Austropuccinia psidii MF-1]|uniref:Uncharacterized protein n=1 Tax=Austropuccinia psidii MF-1 TaxID=1389203 RepID=A0A9Q3BZM6_9BASI|nr:hypothetical protein [Austropuccinia psidii MF-1]
MSKEDQVILTSYAHLLPVIKSLSRFNTSGFPTSNPSKQPQQDSTLVWCSGAHHSRWGVLSQPCVITSNGCLWEIYPDPNLWPIENVIRCMAFGPYLNLLDTYDLRPYPVIIGLLSNSPPPQPPGQYPCFKTRGSILSSKGLWPL